MMQGGETNNSDISGPNQGDCTPQKLPHPEVLTRFLLQILNKGIFLVLVLYSHCLDALHLALCKSLLVEKAPQLFSQLVAINLEDAGSKAGTEDAKRKVEIDSS